MESLVTKVLAKHFNLIIKNFTPDQFTISLTKGEASLSNIDLNEEFIQEVAMIPTNLLVKSVRCNSLVVSLPNVTRIGKDPVKLRLDRIDMTLEEPDVIPPMPNVLRKERSELKKLSEAAPSTASSSDLNAEDKKKKKKNRGADLVRDMHVEIGEVHLDIKTKGRQEGDWNPHVKMHLGKIAIQTTNGEWEVVSLSHCRGKIADEPNIQILYKQATCDSVSISLVESAQSQLSLVQNVPAEVRIIAEHDTATDRHRKITMSTRFNETNLSFNQLSWQSTVQLFSSIKRCLQRPVPRGGEGELVAKDMMKDTMKEKDIKYELDIKNWICEFVTGEVGGQKDGHRIHGQGFHLDVSPRSPLKSADGSSSNVFVSSLDLSLASLSFSGIQPRKIVDPKYADLVGSTVGFSADQQNVEPFIHVKIRHEWASLTDPRKTDFDISLRGLKVVLDRDSWKSLYLFLSGAIIDAVKEELKNEGITSPAAVAGVANAKIEEMQAQIRDAIGKLPPILQQWKSKGLKQYFDWYYNSRVHMHVSGTEIIIPPIDDVTGEDMAIHATFKDVLLVNNPEWETVPYVRDSLVDTASSVVNESTGKSNRFQLDLTGSQLETVTYPINSGSVAPVLLPSTIRMYGKIAASKSEQESSANEGKQFVPRMLLAIHAGDFEFSLNEKQEAFLRKLIPLYRRWFSKIHLSAESKDVAKDALLKAKDAIQKNKDIVGDVLLQACKIVDGETTDKIIEAAKNKNALAAVDVAMKRFQAIILFRAERGVFRIPLHNIGREANAATLSATVFERLPCLTFEGLELLFENSSVKQSASVRLKKLKADNLDHPLSPMKLQLIPLTITGASSSLVDDKSCHHLQISCARDHSTAEGARKQTNIACRLQGMQVITQSKAGGVRSLKDALPDIQIIAKKITDSLIGLKDKSAELQKASQVAGKALDAAEKALDYLDLSWVFEVADCELKLLDSDWNEEAEKNGRKPFGTICISTFNRQNLATRFQDMEKELIETKLQLVTHTSNTDQLLEQIKELQARAEKVAKERDSLEGQLITTKMTLAEWQAKNDELARQLRDRK